eukprot:Tbor_TRINITY_DN4409_c0_g1::TRINITY_DN4409_c0_g1_i1::g.8060::m.8060
MATRRNSNLHMINGNRTHSRLPVGATQLFDQNDESSNIAAGDLVLPPTPITTSNHLRNRALTVPSKPPVMIPNAVMEEGLLMATEGKVSMKNAWDVKVIEGMPQTVESTLTGGLWGDSQGSANGVAGSSGAGCDDDEYATFSKMATVVESGAKVWTHRVDNTYQLSLQMIRRVLRSDRKANDAEEPVEDDDGVVRTNRRVARRRVERTIADSVNEINIEKKSGVDVKHLDHRVSETSNPLFRAITKRFDQGHSGGLLMHNCPMGLVGNLILDLDFSRKGHSMISALSVSPPHTNNSNHNIHNAQQNHKDINGVAVDGKRNREDSTAADAAIDCLDVSLIDRGAFMGLHGEGENEDQKPTMMIDFSAAAVRVGTEVNQVPNPGSLDTIIAGPFNNIDRSSVGGVPSARNSMTTTLLTTTVPPNGQVGISSEDKERMRSVSRAISIQQRDPSQQSNHHKCENDNDDFGDWGDDGGMDYGSVPRDGDDNEESLTCDDKGPMERARDIAAGTWELDNMDRALTAALEDGRRSGEVGIGSSDWSWVAFSQQASDSMAKLQSGGALLASRTLGQIRMLSVAVGKDPDRASQQLQERKKARADKKSVTFLAEDDMISNEGIREAMRKNPTNATALTPIGKEILGYCAISNGSRVMPLETYGVNYHYCVGRATANRMVKTILKREDMFVWLPLLANNVRNFYQPFCTDNSRWGALRKTRHTNQQAIGATRDIGVISHAISGHVDNNSDDERGGDGDEFVAEMPIDLFDDDYNDGDDGDGGNEENEGRGSFFNISLPKGDEGTGSALADFGMLRGSEGGVDARESENLLELPEMIQVLKVKHATMPTQVDVVKLRQVMWKNVKAVSNFDSNGMPHSRVTHIGSKRGRIEDEDDDLPISKNRSVFKVGEKSRFSDVVSEMLPEIPSISKDGTLSPAFFFFSILFLANEHRLLLENDPNDMSDLFISGLAPAVV